MARGVSDALRKDKAEFARAALGTGVAEDARMQWRVSAAPSLLRDTRGAFGVEYLSLVAVSLVVAGAVLVLGYALAGRQQSSVNIVLSNTP